MGLEVFLLILILGQLLLRLIKRKRTEMKLKSFLSAGVIIVLFVYWKFNKENHGESLKTTFKDNFLIGAALNSSQFMRDDYQAEKLIKTQFNSISPENVLKWESIHPEQQNYNFTGADKYVEFGLEENMFIIGHTLVWHSQLPAWVVSGSSPKDSVIVLNRIKEHISTVVGRYKGKIKGWDVVNEALEEDGSLRKSDYLRVLGKSYIQKAFEYAAVADPKAELYYNDYNLEIPAKREGAIRLIKNLKAKGVKVDGIGMQGHWGLTFPSLEEIEKSIILYSELGVKVMITELDISVLKNPWDFNGADVSQKFEEDDKLNPYPKELPDSVQALLAERYKSIFQIFYKHRDKISRVTFWGVNDGQSWLNSFPISNRTNYPLLFDRNYKPKPAYFAVLAAINKQ
jgi:endo-1,4-beta-xylanase